MLWELALLLLEIERLALVLFSGRARRLSAPASDSDSLDDDVSAAVAVPPLAPPELRSRKLSDDDDRSDDATDVAASDVMDEPAPFASFGGACGAGKR